MENRIISSSGEKKKLPKDTCVIDKNMVASYKSFRSGEYTFMIDMSMKLNDNITINLLNGFLEILQLGLNDIDENANLRKLVMDNISWVGDMGIHTGLCINEINCIVIMKNYRQYKFLKLFKKNIEELFREELGS